MKSLNRRRFLSTTAAAGLAALPAARGLAAESGAGESKSALGDSPRASGPSSDDPLGVRASFPVTEELAYLNTASVGPLSVPVRDALRDYADGKMYRRDTSSGREAIAGARSRFARLFGTEEDEIAFLYATSGAENIIASALDWRAGDNVVVDELHFVTTFVLYRELERRHGIELRIIPSREGVVSVDDFAEHTDGRTRLISVAWVSNRNGFRYDLPPLADLAHAHGAYLYADAIQAWGTFPTNLHDEKVDFACGNGYKWLHADFGCAPFYVRAEHLEWMTADRFGHAQVAETLPGHRFRLKTSADKLEYANPAYGPVTAMAAALEFLEGVGMDRIAEHTHALAGELRAGAEALGMKMFTPPRNPSAIVSFYHGLDPERLSGALADDGVAITFQEEGRLLRAAVGMFNNRSDVDRLLGVLAGLV
jgi:selenocysteine lyase/cysteine desulfurase